VLPAATAYKVTADVDSAGLAKLKDVLAKYEGRSEEAGN
jgi:hypothetical protein